MPANPLVHLHELGQDVWLDSLRRSWLGAQGYLAGLIEAGEVHGLTSNPTIFAKALAQDDAYNDQLSKGEGRDAKALLWEVMERDVAAAADVFLPRYRDSGGRTGLVSIELDPSSAFSAADSVEQGVALFQRLDRPNIMVKVPGTEAGVGALPQLLAQGVNVNVTLLFSVERYETIAAAYREGLRRRAEGGGDLSTISSVASFFVSRIDKKVSSLELEAPRQDTVGIANARVAYGVYRRELATPQWQALAAQGAHPQRLLWASTSTKDPALPDTLYVDALAGPDTINTMPEATLDAVRDHGDVQDRLSGAGDEARRQLQRLAEQGLDLDAITAELEEEGVQAFVDSFTEAVEAVGCGYFATTVKSLVSAGFLGSERV